MLRYKADHNPEGIKQWGGNPHQLVQDLLKRTELSSTFSKNHPRLFDKTAAVGFSEERQRQLVAFLCAAAAMGNSFVHYQSEESLNAPVTVPCGGKALFLLLKVAFPELQITPQEAARIIYEMQPETYRRRDMGFAPYDENIDAARLCLGL